MMTLSSIREDRFTMVASFSGSRREGSESTFCSIAEMSEDWHMNLCSLLAGLLNDLCLILGSAVEVIESERGCGQFLYVSVVCAI